MKVLLDFLVLILFFGTYYVTKDIFMATAVAIVGGVIQAIVSWVQYRKLDPMQILSLLVILVFGGATLIFHDENWIKWKPTILYWLFAIILCGGLIARRNFIKELLGKEIHVPDTVWNRLSIVWILFFSLLGVINLWVAYTLSMDQWVTFKVFGTSGLLLVFVVLQGVYLHRHISRGD